MESFLKEVVEGNKFELLIDTNVFSKDVILKAAYTFLDKGYFFFKHDSDNNIILQLTKKSDYRADTKELVFEFSDELLSAHLRNELERDNKEIREAIVNAAIGNSIDVSGFTDENNLANNEEQNKVDFDKDIDDILKEIENDPDLRVDEAEIENILKEIEAENPSTVSKPKITINADAIKQAKEKFNK